MSESQEVETKQEVQDVKETVSEIKGDSKDLASAYQGIEWSPYKNTSYELMGNPDTETWVQLACSRANFRATGEWKEAADFGKPCITIACPYSNALPCNHHFAQLAAILKDEVERKGGKAFVCFPPVISDGETQGTHGMKYSLISREYIADTIELMHEGYRCDAIITVGGCDKSVPGALMPIARMDLIGLTFYGGAAHPGSLPSKKPHGLDAKDTMEGIGAYGAGLIDIEDLYELECHSLPGTGSCSAMFTACTMASIIEALGMSPPGAATNPAVDNRGELGVGTMKRQDCIDAVELLWGLMESKIRCRQIMTRKAFENAITIMYAMGGSTNGYLHLLALAHEADVKLSIDDIGDIGGRVPLLSNMSPHGIYHMVDVNGIGGLPIVLKHLLQGGYLHGDCLTVTGKTLAENLADVPDLPTDQKVIYPLSAPFSAAGNHITVIHGNLAEQSAVIKLSGKVIPVFRGPAIVFNGEMDAYNAIMGGEVKAGMAVVIRYEGPKGSPGMPEMLSCGSALVGRNLGKMCPLITDGRYSGASHGIMIGHVTPEAADGGNIALIENGDVVVIDVQNRRMDVQVSDEEFARRREGWVSQAPPVTKGVLRKFRATVKSAHYGAITS